MSVMVKIRRDVDAPGFSEWLKKAVTNSGKRPDVVAVEADISSSYLYRLMGDRSSVVAVEVVERLEGVLGERYAPPA